MKLQEVVDWINKSNGKIFSVKFRSRRSNAIRVMVCRTQVKKGIVEFPRREPLDFKRYDLIGVYDMQKHAYRSIPMEGIIAIKIEGLWHELENNPADGKRQSCLRETSQVLPD